MFSVDVAWTFPPLTSHTSMITRTAARSMPLKGDFAQVSEKVDKFRGEVEN
jgi:hypothetical protein